MTDGLRPKPRARTGPAKQKPGRKPESSHARPKRGPVDARRDNIIEIAMRRFAAAGFESTTIRQIADEANILSGSLYHHFDTKEEILHEILRKPLDRLLSGARQISKIDGDPELRLVSLLDFELREMITDQMPHTIMYNDRHFLRRTPDFSYVHLARVEIYDIWQAAVEDGIKAGLFRSNIDLFLAIATGIRMISTVADWYRADGGYKVDDVVAFQIEFFIRAIRTTDRIDHTLPQVSKFITGHAEP